MDSEKQSQFKTIPLPWHLPMLKSIFSLLSPLPILCPELHMGEQERRISCSLLTLFPHSSVSPSHGLQCFKNCSNMGSLCATVPVRTACFGVVSSTGCSVDICCGVGLSLAAGGVLCVGAWSISTPSPSLPSLFPDCFLHLFSHSSLSSAAFCSFLNMFSQRRHHLC